jgi:hypothetical protein
VCKPTGGGKNFGVEIVIPSYTVGYTDSDTDREIDRDTESERDAD